MRGQLNEMQEEHRPWMQGDVQFVGPLIFDNDGATVPIRVSLRNSGNSPARNVWRGIRVYAGDRPDDTIMGWEDDLCKRVVRDIGKGSTMFPGEAPAATTFSIAISGSDIASNVDAQGEIILYHNVY
jgi:hypothetical protein